MDHPLESPPEPSRMDLARMILDRLNSSHALLDDALSIACDLGDGPVENRVDDLLDALADTRDDLRLIMRDGSLKDRGAA